MVPGNGILYGKILGKGRVVVTNRDYEQEIKNRVKFIKEMVTVSGSSGIIFANSGGKDSALVGILCKMACENTVSLILPCGVARSYKQDREDALALSIKYNIATRGIDLAETQDVLTKALGADTKLSKSALSNISPRLRMLALYTVGASENRLVAGTSNYSEYYMGYFTKWGDGGCDFNPIRDLTCTEVFEFLKYLDAPACIIDKPPSAGLYEGQTDEEDMGITYESIDRYLLTGEATAIDKSIIERAHKPTAHKRRVPPAYGENNA